MIVEEQSSWCRRCVVCPPDLELKVEESEGRRGLDGVRVVEG